MLEREGMLDDEDRKEDTLGFTVSEEERGDGIEPTLMERRSSGRSWLQC